VTIKILQGDCRDVLKTLPDESVHCVVTSPPYFGLRDYGVDGQIGLEDSPQAFIDALVGTFQEVRRVLREDGTAWVNIGDTYAGSWGAQGRQGKTGQMANRSVVQARSIDAHPQRLSQTGTIRHPGVKAKDLYGVPWMLAFALRADGWWLRQDIIWHKPNPMPESIRDRCTKAHEYIFLLAKSERYYYDALAISEEASEDSGWAKQRAAGVDTWKYNDTEERKAATGQSVDSSTFGTLGRRNKRSVWSVTTKAYDEAHFATFPPDLIEPCILAGCPEGGTVLDPFGGAGTTGLVADRHHRNAILIELNPEYAAMARKRIQGDSPLFAEVA
jgi:DNA modification methylase